VCIPEEHSFCSTIYSESDLDSRDCEEDGSAGNERGGGGSRGGGVGDMSVVSARDYRDYNNGRIEELEGEIKWKGRGKRRSDEKTKGKGVFHGIKGKNKKKSGELWMKNQKNCVLQE
jgi:hypothetical protein